MKKLFFLFLIFPFVGNAQLVTICDYADLLLSFEKEYRKTKGHSYKLREKHKEASKPFEDYFKSKSELEQKNFFSEYEKCPSFQVVIKKYSNESYKIEMDKEIAKNPNDPDAYFARGNAREFDDYDGKLADFTKVIELDPNYADAYIARADLYKRYKLYYYHNAIIDYTKYIEFDPKNESIYFNRGYCKDRLSDFRGAILDYNKALELDNGNGNYYLHRAESKYRLGDYRGALSDLNKAIEINPKDSDYFIWRAKTKLKLYDKESACLDFSKAGELGDSDAYKLIREHCN